MIHVRAEPGAVKAARRPTPRARFPPPPTGTASSPAKTTKVRFVKFLAAWRKHILPGWNLGHLIAELSKYLRSC